MRLGESLLQGISLIETFCLICGDSKTDKHHVKTRGSGGSDDHRNTIHLCRRHHSEVHSIGIVTFFYKYYEVSFALGEKGWRIDHTSGRERLWHSELAEDDHFGNSN